MPEDGWQKEWDFDAREYIALCLKSLIEHSEAINHLIEQNIKVRLDVLKIIKMLERNQGNWRYLIPNLKKYIESHDGLENYVSSNLSKEVYSLSNKINNILNKKKVDKKDYL